MAKKEMQEMLRAAAILSVASLIAKILSAFYRVPYQNLVGDEGFYVYQQIYPFYGLAMTLSLSGLPIFLSKLMQEKKDEMEREKLFKTLFPIIFWASGFLFLLLFLGAPLLARLMGDQQLAPLIQVVAFMYLLTCPLAFLRGNFQGIPWMTPTALSQIGEQFLRVAIIVLAALLFQQFSLSLYATGMIAFCGGFFGGLLAWGVLRYENRRTTANFRLNINKSWFFFPKKAALQLIGPRLLKEGSLIFIYSGLLLFYQLADSFFVKVALEKGGFSDLQAKIEKGIYDRGQPFVQLGLVIALALASTFFPMLTRHFIKGRKMVFQQYALMFLRLTTTLASCATVGLWLVLPFMNYGLFKDNKGQMPLSLFCGAIFLVAVIQAYENILQSQNFFGVPLKAALLGISVKFLTTSFLTHHLLTVGTSLSTLLGLFCTLFYLRYHNDHVLKKYYQTFGFSFKLGGLLSTLVLILGVYQRIFYPFATKSRFLALLLGLGGVILGGVWVLWASVTLNVFTLREWLLLPYGKQIWRFFQRSK